MFVAKYFLKTWVNNSPVLVLTPSITTSEIAKFWKARKCLCSHGRVRPLVRQSVHWSRVILSVHVRYSSWELWERTANIQVKETSANRRLFYNQIFDFFWPVDSFRHCSTCWPSTVMPWLSAINTLNACHTYILHVFMPLMLFFFLALKKVLCVYKLFGLILHMYNIKFDI